MKLGLGRTTLTDDSTIPEEDTGKPALGEVIEEPQEPVDHAVPEKRTDFAYTKKSKVEDKRYQMMVEFPFSSELKRMTTIYLDKKTGQGVVLIKGAVSPPLLVQPPLLL